MCSLHNWLARYSRATPRLLASVAYLLAEPTKRLFRLSESSSNSKFPLPDSNVPKINDVLKVKFTVS
jgi:hypothetical protein